MPLQPSLDGQGVPMLTIACKGTLFMAFRPDAFTIDSLLHIWHAYHFLEADLRQMVQAVGPYQVIP